MKFDHIALTSKNIHRSVNWYVDKFNAEVLYQDDTWGYIQFGDVKIAFVSSCQHPPHICFEVNEDYIKTHLSKRNFKNHRDGTESCYLSDCDGNVIEFLKCQIKNG